MWPYWLFFLVPAYMAITRPKQIWSSSLSLVLLLLVSIFVGFRYQVGGDWEIYLENQLNNSGLSFLNVIQNTIEDPGYEFLAWASDSVGFGIYGVNFICAVLFSTGLIRFCRAQPRPWLALTLSIPYLVIVVAMGYTRQSVAIGLIMLALLSLEKYNLPAFFLQIAAGALFHKTAVVIIALALPSILSSGKLINKIFSLLLVFLIALSLFYTFLAPRLDFYVFGYEDQAMQSEGAAIRVAMVVIPAFIVVLFSQRFRLIASQQFVWLALAYASIACLVLLAVLKSSTVVDRLALYCIPLQMFVGSRLIDLKLVNVPKSVALSLIVAAAAMVQFVWLNYAITAFAWLPYQNILFSL